MHIKQCRACNQQALLPVLRLGNMPLVNHFLSNEDLRGEEPKFPLNLCVCSSCSLAQLDHVVPPAKMFRRYHYLTSASRPLLEHFRALAQTCMQRGFIKKGSKVLDIGANDGTLLFEIQKFGCDVLGVDPSLNAIEEAKKIGIEVLPHLFDVKVAEALRRKYGKFDLITGTNVFAHTHEIVSFLKGAKMLLGKKGVLILEFAHLLDMVLKNQFDVIYHEHICYFTLRALMPFFKKHGLEIFDASKVLTQGGSLRIYICHPESHVKRHPENLQAIFQEEADTHLHEMATLRRFAEEVHSFRDEFRELLTSLSANGKKIVGFGAPAKGVILLNYAKAGSREISYLVDSTELKQGRFFPGNHIPVFSERKLENDSFDYVLILSWNFQDAILEKLEPYRKKGVKVIIPFPKLRVI